MGGNARKEKLSADELSKIGKKAAKARSRALTKAQRKAIAKKAAEVRWAEKK